MLQTDSQKLFISSLLHGKWISQGGCQSFLQCFWWSAEAGGVEGWRMAFRDATPETWCTQSHCLIGLSIQLTLLYCRGQGSNQFNMVAGGGTATQQWVQPTYEHMQHWSRHMGHSTARDFIFLTLLLLWDVLSYNPPHCAGDIWRMCDQLSTFRGKSWHTNRAIASGCVEPVELYYFKWNVYY